MSEKRPMIDPAIQTKLHVLQDVLFLLRQRRQEVDAATDRLSGWSMSNAAGTMHGISEAIKVVEAYIVEIGAPADDAG